MRTERWEAVQEVVAGALELSPEERGAYVAKSCADDEEVRREVESLLGFAPQAEGFLKTPALTMAATLLADGDRGLVEHRSLGRYELLSILGTGGMATVYLARDPQLGRKVALKTLAPDFRPADGWDGMLEREARAASALNHPNILTIYEIGEASGIRFIAEEFVDGATLREQMEGRRLPLAEVLTVMRQVCAALGAAHTAGIVHRDVKPDNVMVRPDGYVKVLDFGLATWTESLTAEQVLRAWQSGGAGEAQSGGTYGTIAYLAPEQVRGQAPDARADVFSTGVVLYELLTGRLPFTGADDQQTMAAILMKAPPPPERFRPEIPRRLSAAVARALEKDREERLGSMAELDRELEQVEAELRSPAPVRERIDTVRLSRPPAPRPRRRWIAALAGLLLLAVALAWWALSERAAGPETVDSLAVLPLLVDGEPDSDYLSEGLADGLIGSLSGLPDLRVTSLNAVSRYRGTEVDAQSAGRDLGVEAVLVGRLRMGEGDNYVVGVELIGTRDGRRLWGRQYERNMSELALLPREIAREVSSWLERPMAGAPAATEGRVIPAEAYRQYLKGRYYWNRRTEEDLRRAIEHFTLATTEVPDFASAYAGLADSYALLSNYGVVRPQEAARRARSAALMAVELDDDLAEGHASLGLVLKDHDWDFAAADESLRRAIELNPGYAPAHHWYAENLVVLGRFDEAIEAMRLSAELDPFSLIISAQVGWALHQARRHEEAAEQLRRTIDLGPEFARAHFFLGRVYEQLGRFDEAVSATRRAIELAGNNALFEASLVHILARAGRVEEARERLAALGRRAEAEYVPPSALALALAGLGEVDRAVARLDQAYDERDSILPYFLWDPQLDPLRQDPRLPALIERLVGSRAGADQS